MVFLTSWFVLCSRQSQQICYLYTLQQLEVPSTCLFSLTLSFFFGLIFETCIIYERNKLASIQKGSVGFGLRTADCRRSWGGTQRIGEYNEECCFQVYALYCCVPTALCMQTSSPIGVLFYFSLKEPPWRNVVKTDFSQQKDLSSQYVVLPLYFFFLMKEHFSSEEKTKKKKQQTNSKLPRCWGAH